MRLVVAINNTNNNSSSTTPTTTTITTTTSNITGAGAIVLLLIGADDDDVFTLDTEPAAVTTHARAGGGGDTFDESIGGILEPAPVRFIRRHVARPHGDEGAHGDGRAGAQVEALRHGRAVIVEQQIARRRERRRGQRRRHGAAQHQDRSGSLEHWTGAKHVPGRGGGALGSALGVGGIPPQRKSLTKQGAQGTALGAV